MVRTKRGGGFKQAGGFAKKRSSPDDDDDDDSALRASKKSRGDEEDESLPVVPELKTDDEGNAYIGLNTSGKRRVTVQDYQKSTLINIREYYITDAGETKPGKKGISLTVDQYNTLLAAAPLIESALAKKDLQVARPDYDADLSAKPEVPKEDKDKDEEEEAAEEAVAKVDEDEEDEE